MISTLKTLKSLKTFPLKNLTPHNLKAKRPYNLNLKTSNLKTFPTHDSLESL